MTYTQAFNAIRKPLLAILKTLRPIVIAADALAFLVVLGMAYEAGWNVFFVAAAGVAAPVAVEGAVLVTFLAMNFALPLIPMWRSRKVRK